MITLQLDAKKYGGLMPDGTPLIWIPTFGAWVGNRRVFLACFLKDKEDG